MTRAYSIPNLRRMVRIPSLSASAVKAKRIPASYLFKTRQIQMAD
jgi:hypothetical protein